MTEVPFELVNEIEALGLRIENAVLIQGDTFLVTDDGIQIYIFDPITELAPRIEYNGLVYFTPGGSEAAIDIVNTVEAIKLARVTR